MPFLMVDHQKIFYTSHPGITSHPPLVLIHGAGGNHLYWPPQLRRLPGVSVYAPDLPGHGRSAGQGCERIVDYREWLCTFADALRLPPFVLAGHSMGGAIALDFALAYPERLMGLGLVGANSRLRVAPAILQGIQNDFSATTETLIQWMYGSTVTPAQRRTYLQRLREVSPDLLYADFSACDAFDVSARVGEIKLPTLIIGGQEDKMTPVKYSERLHEQIRQSELHLVAQAGHMMMLEQPAVVTALFAAFMDQVSTQ
ncbi:MAG: alpha/beta hydrolase [Caldilineaceae bacterium]